MITENEKNRRREALEQAKTSMKLSEIVIPDELMQIAEDYVEGKYTPEEFTNKYTEAVERWEGSMDKAEKKSLYIMMTEADFQNMK